MATTFYSDVTTDQRVAEILNGDFEYLAADRYAFPNHPAMIYAGDFKGLGTRTKKIPLLGLDGYDLPAAIAEGASLVPQAVTDQQITLTIGKYGKAYEATDEVRFSDGLGVWNAGQFAMDAARCRELLITYLLARLVGGFSRTAGSTGVNLTVANILTAIAELEIGSQASFAPGEVCGILHTQQMADFRDAFSTSTSGGFQWMVTPEDIRIKGTGYRGSMFGVDWFASSYVPSANAGADRGGGIFRRGGVYWSDMSVDAETADAIAIGGKVLFERIRQGLAGITAYSHTVHLGASRGYDTSPHQMGCSIITDL